MEKRGEARGRPCLKSQSSNAASGYRTCEGTRRTCRGTLYGMSPLVQGLLHIVALQSKRTLEVLQGYPGYSRGTRGVLAGYSWGTPGVL